MIATLLPGLRELRGPIAAGYLWFLTVWLALGSHFPSRARASPLWAAIYELRDAVSPVGLAFAVTFAAYLVGSISHPFLDRVLAAARARCRRAWHERKNRGIPPRQLHRLPSEAAVTYAGELSGHGSWVLANYVVERINAAYPDRSDYPGRPDSWDAYDHHYRTVLRELDYIERRLMAKHPALYAEADRLRSEADLRRAITPPLLVLAAAVAFRGGWGWLLPMIVLAIAVLVMYDQGQRRWRDRNDFLVSELADHLVDAPVLERLDAMAERVRQAEEEQRRRQALV